MTDPIPMTPAEILDLVDRVKKNMLVAKERALKASRKAVRKAVWKRYRRYYDS